MIAADGYIEVDGRRFYSSGAARHIRSEFLNAAPPQLPVPDNA